MEALYLAYADRLLRLVRRCAVDRGLSEARVDAEGVVHETFEQLLKTRDPIRDPPAWLFTVARRLVGKVAAHQHRIADGDPEKHLQAGDARWSSLAAEATTEDIYHARQVVAAIAGLPDRQRVATYLSKVEAWTQAEVGDYLQCATATVAVHIHRALPRLRDELWVKELCERVPAEPGDVFSLGAVLRLLRTDVYGPDLRDHGVGEHRHRGRGARPKVMLVAALTSYILLVILLIVPLARRLDLPPQPAALVTGGLLYIGSLVWRVAIDRRRDRRGRRSWPLGAGSSSSGSQKLAKLSISEVVVRREAHGDFV